MSRHSCFWREQRGGIYKEGRHPIFPFFSLLKDEGGAGSFENFGWKRQKLLFGGGKKKKNKKNPPVNSFGEIYFGGDQFYPTEGGPRCVCRRGTNFLIFFFSSNIQPFNGAFRGSQPRGGEASLALKHWGTFRRGLCS